MKKNQLSKNLAAPHSAAMFLLLGLAAAPALAAPITGDTVTGDLTVEGGSVAIDDGTDRFELRLGNDRIDLWHDDPGQWVWSHGATPTDVMSLDSFNVLSLYNLGSMSAEPSIVLDPGNPDASPVVPPLFLSTAMRLSPNPVSFRYLTLRAI